jgi:UDP-glucuronate decarboxylase
MYMRSKIIEEDLRTIVDSPLPWNKFSGTSILITGATGFIAAYIAETLLYLNERKGKNPIRIICLVRNRKRALQRFSDYRNRKDIVFWVQDACDPMRHKEKVDYIIHAASYATPSKYGIDPVGTLLPNVLGTYRLLEFAKQQQVKSFLFISSGEVYTSPPIHITCVKETDVGRLDPLVLRSCYAESKRMGETMSISWFHQYGVPIKIARLFHTYGPGMKLDDGRVHSDFVGAVVRNQDIIMKSDGQAIRTFCYVADTVKGFFTILLKGKIGEAYNVGSDKTLSIRKLAEKVISLYPEKKLHVTKNIHSQGKQYLESQNTILCPDVSKIRNLGWRPAYSLQKGLRRTIDSYVQ